MESFILCDIQLRQLSLVLVAEMLEFLNHVIIIFELQKTDKVRPNIHILKDNLFYKRARDANNIVVH